MSEDNDWDGPPLENVVETALKNAEKNAKFQKLYDDKEHVHFLVPKGMDVRQLRSDLSKPFRKSGRRSFDSVKSFCNYVLKHKVSGETIIIADENEAVVKAIINDHSGDAKTGWGDFIAFLKIGFSKQWLTWSKAAHSEGDNYFSQEEFAGFLEQNRGDVMAGKVSDAEGNEVENMSALELSAMITNLETTFEESFTSKVDDMTGRKVLHFQNDDVGKGTINIPRQLIIAIPIYKSGDFFQIRILIYHRIGNGQARFFFKIDQVELKKEQAFDSICEQIDVGNVGSEKDKKKEFAGTGVEVYKGSV